MRMHQLLSHSGRAHTLQSHGYVATSQAKGECHSMRLHCERPKLYITTGLPEAPPNISMGVTQRDW